MDTAQSPTWKTKALEWVKNPKFYIYLIVAGLFIAAAIYVYKTYVVPKTQKQYVANKEFVEQDTTTNKVADLYFFYTDWCPHCKRAKPEWDKLKAAVSQGRVNGYKINFYEVDCEKNKDLADKFKVEGYPTIKLTTGKQVILFDAKPEKGALMQFLQTVLK